MNKYTKEELYKMDVIDVYKMVLKGDNIKKFPVGFWEQAQAKENAMKCTKYLIEEILKYDEDMIKQKASVNLFRDNKLSGMLLLIYDNKPYEAINNAYPNKYKEWEFKQVPAGYWDNKDNAIKSIKWLIEEKLKLSDNELKQCLSKKLFKDNGLGGMLDICFSNSPYEAINNAYPNKYREWEFKTTPQGYWNNKENAIKAVKWLIEERLKFSDEDLKEYLSLKLFYNNGLRFMLESCFDGSPYKAINSAYPGKFKEWEFKVTPSKYWNIDNGIKATKWLIEEKLKLSDEELKEQLSVKLFRDNGLNGMLQKCFNNSPYEAINITYPNKYKEWEFKQVPKGYWDNKDNKVKAVKWLIEEKLKLSDEELKEKLSKRIFNDNGLKAMLQYCFNGSTFEAINIAYPNKFKKTDFKSYNNKNYTNSIL